MKQEPTANRKATVEIFDDMTITEIAEELERRLRTIHKGNWPDGNQTTTEAVKASLIVHYGPPGHRIKMTRSEALRFLDIFAEEAPSPV